MDMQEKIETARQQIWQAVSDYGEHSSMTAVLDDVSEDFVSRLAEDSVNAKMELREMFRKSPAWDEELDALVINGTRTHDPDYSRVRELALQILSPAIPGHGFDISVALELFTNYGGDHTDAIAAINRLAPKAYAPGKKPSRIFKAICEALGVADNTAGSEFQYFYAQLADELSAKKISYKLFVSLNPAHFVTMSNPKEDSRGKMLTSCHSFNSTEYDYPNGCSGYARDNCTMIAFTVADLSNPELLNNRKTTRQLFMYRPGNGLLLQSRMYNSSGGTTGAQAESKVYRDLIQREISECEDVPNLWKTFKYYCNDKGVHFPQGRGFGGYPDWPHEEFAAMFSIREDHAEDFETFAVGTYGLCISCGCETSGGLYCNDCGGTEEDDESCYCADCGDRCDEDDLCTVFDRYGNERRVCEHCRSINYTYCDCCDDYIENDAVEEVGDGDWVCGSCRDRYYEECDECGKWHHKNDMSDAVDSFGDDIRVCDDCREQYYVVCADCGRCVHKDDTKEAHRHGDEVVICSDCRERNYEVCAECGEVFHSDDLDDDDMCCDCAKEKEEDEVA
ncbi:MAG: hypothetical protein IJ741_07065 [Schwartzia sp.]|nr:hypothetical protein [Schwartzia sp. (in: firmicutes)]